MSPIDTVLHKIGTPLIKNTTSQKWHPTQMTSHKNRISQLHYRNYPRLKTTPTIKHRRTKWISAWSGKNSALKSHDHESELYKKIKNSLTQFSRWQTTFSHYLVRCSIKDHFFKAPKFVCFRWRICHMPFWYGAIIFKWH